MSMQRTQKWYAARIGHVTASRMGDMMAKTKKGWGAERKYYFDELVYERVTGKPMNGAFVNPPMQWGLDHEDDARMAYSLICSVDVQKADFCPHPTIPLTGASPDGLIGDDGLLEIKCPNSATHWATLDGGGIDEGYIYQMQWQMACTDRQWCDWCSFDPRWPPHMQMVIRHIERDQAMIDMLATEVVTFSAEIDEKIKRWKP